jgi:membrane protein
MKFFKTIARAGHHWVRGNAPAVAAGLTYYTLASLVPLLIVLISIASLWFDPAAAEAALTDNIAAGVGEQNAALIRSLANTAGNRAAGLSASLIGGVLVMMSASNLLRATADALNRFWEPGKPPPAAEHQPLARRALKAAASFLKEHLKAFALTAGAGLLLLGTLFLSTALGVAGKFFDHILPPGFSGVVLLHLLVSFLITTILFSLIFRYAPRHKVAWRCIWQGAAVGGFIYVCLQSLVSLYLTHAGVGSAYGAAGSLVALLFWVYYSIQGMLFGAAFTIVQARGESGAPRRATTVQEMEELLVRSFPRNERWQAFQPRPSDIIITPYAKCGTTWLQQIAHGLRTRGSMDFNEITEVTPWIENAALLGWDLDAEQAANPRLFKSHLAWREVPKGARYIVIGLTQN